MKTRSRILAYSAIALLGVFLMIAIYGIDELHRSQNAASDQETATRALLELKAAAISTIMLDPALPETRQVFTEAEQTIRQRAAIIYANQHNQELQRAFAAALQIWDQYDLASNELINKASSHAKTSKTELLNLYHVSFEPLQAKLVELTEQFIEAAEAAKSSADAAARLIYWVLLPLLTILCLLVAGLMLVLQSYEASTRAILNTAVESIIQIDEQGSIQECNSACENMFGYTRSELIGANITLLMPESFKEKHKAQLAHYLATGESHVIGKSREVQGRRKDGSVFPIELDVGEAHIRKKCIFTGIIKDITARKITEQEMRIAAIAFDTQEGIIITNAEKRIIRVNQAFTTITGYTPEDVIGKTPAILRSGQHPDEFYHAMNKKLATDGCWKGEICNRKKDGSIFHEWLTITVVKDEYGITTNYVGTIADITKRKLAEDTIRNLAFFDPLTHLANRRQFLNRLERSVSASIRNGSVGAILFLDLDKFKLLNDTMGHHYGDLLLCEVASRLQSCVRAEDIVARLGGDEFCVMLENLGTEEEAATSIAKKVGTKIVAALGRPYVLHGHVHHGSSSVGIALYHRENTDTEAIINQADSAMYQAKRAGRNTWRFYAQIA